MSFVTFEKLYLPDTQEVRELLDSVWEDTYVDCLTPQAMERISQNWTKLKEFGSEEEQSVFCSAAMEDGNIAGIAIARRKSDEKAEIKRLYVLPDKQGKGIGGQLLRSVMGAFSAVKTVELLVEKQNTLTIGFYTKHNFLQKEELEKEKNGTTIHLIKMEFSLK